MGKTDDATKELMKKNEFFADAFNYLFRNKLKLNPEELSDMSESEIVSFLQSDSVTKTESIQKYRDIMKHAVVKKGSKTYYILLGIENQTCIDYSMVIRCMLYDTLRYWNQVNKIINEHKKLQEEYRNKKYITHEVTDWERELLEKSPLQLFGKKDKLYPVVTLVIYFGNEDWDGPRTLKEMLTDLPKGLASFVNDFKMNLIVPKEILDFKQFTTDFGIVMKALSYTKSERKEFHQFLYSVNALDFDAANVINICTGGKLELVDKGGKVSMNNIMGELLEDMKEQGMQEGIQQGIQQGMQQGMQHGTVRGTLITLAKYGKLRNEELIEAAVTICGNDYQFVESVYQELLQKGELKEN